LSAEPFQSGLFSFTLCHCRKPWIRGV
jgi:hypothetical protein